MQRYQHYEAGDPEMPQIRVSTQGLAENSVNNSRCFGLKLVASSGIRLRFDSNTLTASIISSAQLLQNQARDHTAFVPQSLTARCSLRQHSRSTACSLLSTIPSGHFSNRSSEFFRNNRCSMFGKQTFRSQPQRSVHAKMQTNFAVLYLRPSSCGKKRVVIIMVTSSESLHTSLLLWKQNSTLIALQSNILYC